MDGNGKRWYKVIFKQIQPIHIGMGNYGVISETRIFIPGWTMWGALTKAYNLKERKDLSENWELFENISCFYPAFESGDNFEILLPEFRDGEFYLGRYSESEFRAKFVDTFVSTAIEPLQNTALEGSLHELNVILPGVKADHFEDEKEKQLYWTGIVKIKDVEMIPEDIYVGGDIKYGLGKMTLLKQFEELTEDSERFKKFKKANYIEVSEEMEANVPIELLVEAVGYKNKDLEIKKKGYFYIPGHNCIADNYILIEGRLTKPSNAGG